MGLAGSVLAARAVPGDCPVARLGDCLIDAAMDANGGQPRQV